MMEGEDVPGDSVLYGKNFSFNEVLSYMSAGCNS